MRYLKLMLRRSGPLLLITSRAVEECCFAGKVVAEYENIQVESRTGETGYKGTEVDMVMVQESLTRNRRIVLLNLKEGKSKTLVFVVRSAPIAILTLHIV